MSMSFAYVRINDVCAGLAISPRRDDVHGDTIGTILSYNRWSRSRAPVVSVQMN